MLTLKSTQTSFKTNNLIRKKYLSLQIKDHATAMKLEMIRIYANNDQWYSATPHRVAA